MTTTDALAVPIARTTPYTFSHLGRTFSDPYHWLEDKTNPDVIAYLEAENAYASAALAHTAALQETLYQEMYGRIPQDDRSAPERRGENFYYWRLETGKQYRIFCRKQGSLDAPEEILLDENALAEGHEYCRVSGFEPSPDQSLLAYSVDFTGSWVFDLYVLDLSTGQIVAGPIPNTAWTLAWASDNRTLFYTVFDKAHRSYQALRHVVGAGMAATAADEVIFHEPDDAFTVVVEHSRSGSYLFTTAYSQVSSEVWFLPADQPTAPLSCIEPRRSKVEYYAEHHGDRFLIRTNEDAVNFKLMTAPVDQPARANWREVIAHRADVLLEGVDPFQDDLVVYERQNGLHRLRLSAVDGISDVRYIPFPEPVYAIRRTENPEFATSVLRFTYASLVTPESVIDYDMRGAVWQVVKQQQVPSGYDASQYESERLYATAPDGAQVPISLVYRKGRPRDGSQPLLLYAYGSYGYSIEVDFSPLRLSLLDRGFAFAIAHVRGGSELGREWYENGRMMHKKNTFTDFIACAEHLIADGCAHPRKLTIMGGSVGGLLVAAVANLRPDLFGAVLALVPFTNVITAMLDPNLPLTVTEYDQWGNPNDPQTFDYMLSYSPYENIEAKDYPPIFVQAGLNDLQVPYWDPAKWVAKLRASKTDSSRLVLVTKMGAGHGGSSGRYDKLREYAQYYAFLIDTVG